MEERDKQQAEFEKIMKEVREQMKKEDEGKAGATEGAAAPEGASASEGTAAAEGAAAPEGAAASEAPKGEEQQVATLEKTQKARDARAEGEDIGDSGKRMRAQKEITLAKDLELRDRQDIYKNFLMYWCARSLDDSWCRWRGA